MTIHRHNLKKKAKMNGFILNTRRLEGVKKANNNDNKNVNLFSSPPPPSSSSLHVSIPDITIDTDIVTSPKKNKQQRPKYFTKSFQRAPPIINNNNNTSNPNSITKNDEVSTNLLLRFNNANNMDDNVSTRQSFEHIAKNSQKIVRKKKHTDEKKESKSKTNNPPQPKPKFRIFISTKKRVRYTHILSDKAGIFPTEDTMNGPIVYNNSNNNNRHNREATKLKSVKQTKQTPLWLLPMYELSSHSSTTTAATTTT